MKKVALAITLTSTALVVHAQVTLLNPATQTPTGFLGWSDLGGNGSTTVQVFNQFPGVLSIEHTSPTFGTGPGSWGLISYDLGNLNISGYDSLSITAARETGDSAGSPLVIALSDVDSVAAWSFPDASIQELSLTTVTLPISSPSVAATGGDNTLNLADIRTLQIWMNTDYPTPNLYSIPGSGSVSPLHYHISDISAVPEPATYGMIATLGLLGFAAYRRFHAKAAV